MIDFNVPPYVGTELKYVAEAVEKNHKICGDGPFTKFISGYQNRYGDNLKPPTNVYHRMTA